MGEIIDIEDGYAKKFGESHRLAERIGEKTEAINIYEQEVKRLQALVSNPAYYPDKAEDLDYLVWYQKNIAVLIRERGELQKKLDRLKPESE